MRFKLPIVLFALFALTAAACSSSETVDDDNTDSADNEGSTISTTTTIPVQEVIAMRIADCEEGDTSNLTQCIEGVEEDYPDRFGSSFGETEDVDALRSGLLGDGSDEIIQHVSTGYICNDFNITPPDRDAGQATDLDENGVPYGTKIRTSHLPHSQPITELTEFEGSEFLYRPWNEYEGRKVWESYPADIELYHQYFSRAITQANYAAPEGSNLVLDSRKPDEYRKMKAKYQTLGCEWAKTVREIWDTADIYTPEAQARIDAGETVYRYNDSETGILSIIDPTAGFPLVIQYDDNGRPDGEYYSVCPPSPLSDDASDPSRYNLRGVDPGLIEYVQLLLTEVPDEDTPEMKWFLSGITSPEGKQIWRGHQNLVSDMRALLNLSPGEPSDTTLHSNVASYYPSLIVDGYFPGDWSENSLEFLNRQLASAAAYKMTSTSSIMAASEASIYERCTDLESASSQYFPREDSEVGILEQNLSKGVDAIPLGDPASEIYVASHTTYFGYAIVCFPGVTWHLKDSFTGEKVPTKTRAEFPASVIAHVYSNIDNNFVFAGHVAEKSGKCNNADGSASTAFDEVLAQVNEHFVAFHPAWEEVPVDKFYSVNQEEVWNAYRDPAYSNTLLCEAGIPYGEIVDGSLTRPIDLGCTEDQWQAMERAALESTKRSDFLVGQYIGQISNYIRSNTLNLDETEFYKWFEKNSDTWLSSWYTENIPTREYIGCGDRLTNHLDRPYAVGNMGDVAKKPWMPGFLPDTSTADEWGYPNPFSPCEGWEAPSEEKHWWPLLDE